MTTASSSAEWPARLFTAATLLWSGVLPMATLAARDGSGAPHALAASVYAIGHVLCHQRPERSFSWAGQAWPVCARCTGIYLGAAIGVLLAQALRRRTIPDAPTVRLWLAAAALPATASLLYEWTTGQMPAHPVRALTGGLVGLAAAVLIAMFLREWRAVAPTAEGTVGHEVN